MPHTYIVAVGPGVTGRTCASAVSNNRNGGPDPGTVGTAISDQDCMIRE